MGGDLPRTHHPVPVEQRLGWDPRREPCIPAVTSKGDVILLSLHELLHRSDDLVGIDCRTAGETVAVIEFLMAICFASRNCPATSEEWADWIRDERSLQPAAGWLMGEPDEHWDLFHPDTPLGQNSLLAVSFEESGTGTAQLVIERAGDYNQLFDHHHLEDGEPLLAADAFRAMLTQHVYGPYGRARISGDKLGSAITHMATSRLLGRIRVVPLGRTLGETLRLNLYPPPGGDPGRVNTSWTSGTVVRRTFEKRPDPRVPEGPADLHSALGRSVLLHPARAAGGAIVVDRVLIGSGETLDLDPELHLQDAVFSRTVGGELKPLWPSPTRALWQEAHALYSAVKDAQPGLYARLRSLGTRGVRRRGEPFQLWAVGLVANKSLPVSWTDGHFPYAPAMEASLYRASRRGSRIAEYLAWSLKRAAIRASETVHSAARADEARQVARFDAREKFWPGAAKPFEHLLDAVIDAGYDDPDTSDPEGLVEEPLRDYTRTLTDLARTHLVHRLDTLPPNQRGFLARAEALKRFDDDISHPKAPAELRGETALD
ncbi:type I-E CRISPR-associated protein Cse1/CasA [Kitasatospora sp. NPDC094019]|uniref:type I-E CRISPR-associated protein Cse1/CasA n=1 Tax=Kitasatospora sp. NPDC094019 TaxID=3364091 RepID=UPI003814161B